MPLSAPMYLPVNQEKLSDIAQGALAKIYSLDLSRLQNQKEIERFVGRSVASVLCDVLGVCVVYWDVGHSFFSTHVHLISFYRVALSRSLFHISS